MATKKKTATISYPVKKPVLPARVKTEGCGTLKPNSLRKIGVGRAQLFWRAAADFNRLAQAAADKGFDVQIVGSYRTLATMQRLFHERYKLKPNGRVPQVTRRYNGKTYYLQKGKSPVAVPPQGTPPNQVGGSMHGYGCAVDVNVSNPQFLAWLRRNAPKYNFYWQGQPTKNGKTNPEWEPWHLNWVPAS
jgi:hypothetical protein